MPRNTKGIGRTGSKHKNNAVADPDAQSTINEGVRGPPSNPVPQKTATAVDKVAAQTGPAPSVEDSFGDFSWLGAGIGQLRACRAHIHATRTPPGTASSR